MTAVDMGQEMHPASGSAESAQRGLAGGIGACGALPEMKVTVAPTGARRSKSDHPNLPLTVDEIARAAAECLAVGAREIHLHVRDGDGAHSIDPGLYREAISEIQRAAPGMAIQVTTEAAGRFEVTDQLRTLASLRPKAASVSVREMQRDPATAARLYALALTNGTRVQHILYDVEDLSVLRAWQKAGIVPDAMRDVLLVLGRYVPAADARPGDLIPFVEALGKDYPDWTVCAFGRSEHMVAVAAAGLGGHVRIGFENNVLRPDGSPAADNAENIARIVTTARTMGRRLANQEILP